MEQTSAALIDLDLDPDPTVAGDPPVGPGDWLVATLVALVPAATLLVIALPGLGRRALWNDEYATWHASTLSAGDLLRLINHVDVLLAPYYVFMHLWIDLFGDSAASLRMPSVLAMATAAGCTALLGRRLFGSVVGLGGAVLFTVLPAVSRYAQEARPYALVTALTAAAGLLLLRAFERPGWWRWRQYGAALVAIAALHVVAVTVLAAHWLAVLDAYRARRDMRMWRWFAVPAVLLTVMLPLVSKGHLESGAINWIRADPIAVAKFPGKLFGALPVAAAVVAVAAVSAVLLWRVRRPAVRLLAVWAVLPPVFCYLTFPLLHLFLYRYLLFTLPAWCLLAGAVGLGWTDRWWRGAWAISVAIAALVAGGAFLGLPGQHAARRSPVLGEPDFRASAALVSQRMDPGDGIAYAGAPGGRRAFSYELRHRRAPRDVFLAVPAQRLGTYGASECHEPGGCARDTERIWLVSTASTGTDAYAQMPRATAGLLRDEFVQAHRWQFENVAVILLTRAPRG